MHSRFARVLCAALISCAVSTASAQGVWPAITDQPVAKRVPGRWVWVELVSSDVAASRTFYSTVFGWTFEAAAPGAEGETYWRAMSSGRPVAGVMKSRSSNVNRTARWIGVASSDDPQAAAARASEAGGKVVLDPRRLEGRGDLALLADPAGAQFAILRADGGDPAERVPAVNDWLWIELWADDPDREAAFYRKVFGYAVEPADTPGQRSLLLLVGGKARAGILRKPDASLPTEWVPYLRVESVERTVERAVKAGARVVVAPTAHHRSRLAVLTDPGGAAFAVAEWRPQ